MHIAATVETEKQTAELAKRFKEAGIRYAFELQRTDRGDRFDILILKDEDLPRAKRIIKNYAPGSGKNEANKVQDDPILPKPALRRAGLKKNRRRGPACLFIACLCVLFFITHEVQRRKIVVDEARVHVDMIIVTPMMKWMLIDYPKAFEYIVDFQNAFPQVPNPSFKDITQTQRKLKQKSESTPFWGGLYPLVISRFSGEVHPAYEGPLFERIKNGELWRFITPAFLHDSFLHLFFNMLWLLTIGSLIERRIGSKRILGLMLVLALGSNFCQYLVSGPLFLGFSGVACGFFGFIFARREVAPWENYKVEPAVFWLFFGYVGVLALIQLVLFSMELLQNPTWPLRTANTAHIIGVAMGYGLGRLPYFAWQVRR